MSQAPTKQQFVKTGTTGRTAAPVIPRVATPGASAAAALNPVVTPVTPTQEIPTVAAAPVTPVVPVTPVAPVTERIPKAPATGNGSAVATVPRIPRAPLQLPNPANAFTGWLTRPASRGSKITGFDRVYWICSGFLVMLFDTFLSVVFMGLVIPAFQQPNGAPVSTGAAIAGMAMSFIFTSTQLFFWKGGHTPAVVVMCSGLVAVNVCVNIRACMFLLGVATLTTNEASVIVVTLAGSAAIVGERFMSVGFRD